MVRTDDDGDLILERRSQREIDDAVLSEMHLETLHEDIQDGYCRTIYPITGSGPLYLYHRLITSLNHVGCQVWRGAALLADYLLNVNTLHGNTVLELGAGPGLVSLAAARAGASCIFATDIPRGDILKNCLRNVAANNMDQIIRVRELDWMAPPACLINSLQNRPEENACGSSVEAVAVAGNINRDFHVDTSTTLSLGNEESYQWTLQDLEDIRNLDYVIAADTIYDDILTEAFMLTALRLLLMAHNQQQHRHKHRPTTSDKLDEIRDPIPISSKEKYQNCTTIDSTKRSFPRLLVALERRECFTLRDLDICAPAYDYWRTLFHTKEHKQSYCGAAVDARLSETREKEKERGDREEKGSNIFVKEKESSIDKGSDFTKHACIDGWVLCGYQMDVSSVPQRVQGYERVDHLELWELEAVRKDLLTSTIVR